MTQTMLHIVFTASGVGSLRQALKNAGRDDEVISFFDDLSFGPINPPDSAGDTFGSAPISFFDSLLMSHVTDDWRKVAKIVGFALAAQMDERIFQTGDIFLAARINALAESGRLEIRGKSALEMHFSEVRLPKSSG
jgi:hypothetical protein